MGNLNGPVFAQTTGRSGEKKKGPLRETTKTNPNQVIGTAREQNERARKRKAFERSEEETEPRHKAEAEDIFQRV